MSPSDPTRPDDPRVRAAQTKRNRTRRALLDAAEATFSSRGWARTRMEDVAVAGGVSAATAYNHFPSKHALLGHVYRPLVLPLIAAAEQDIAAGRPMIDALEDQIRALARTTFRHQRLTAAFWSAVQEYTIKASGRADPDDAIDPRTLAPVPEPLRLLVEHGQGTEELRAFPSAPEVSAMIVNLLLLRSVTRPLEDPDDTARLLLTVMFGSLRPELVIEREGDGWPARSSR